MSASPRYLVLALVAALMSACRDDFNGNDGGDGVDISDTVVSGERLRATWLESGDLRVFDSWFDTELGIACSLTLSEDDRVTCTPLNGQDPGGPLAGGTIVREEIDDRVGWDVAVGDDDDWRQLVRIHDLERDFGCYAGGPLAEVCAPEQVAYVLPGVSYHTDAACEGPAFAYTTGSYDPVAVTELIDTGDACGGYISQYFEIGPDEQGSVFVSESAMCEPAGQGVRAWGIGTEIPASSLIPVDSLTLGEGRLRAALPVTPDGIPLSAPTPSGFTDTELGVECTAIAIADSGIRCVPTDRVETIVSLFADAACTQPLASLPSDPCAGAPDWIIATADPSLNEANELVVQSLYKRGSAHAGEVFAQVGTCEPTTIGDGEVVYELSEEFSVSDLALLLRATD